ncbi:hypothetical protein M5K25_010338 [Dendrobium thyrsiflorum]|uniref:Uncharacterized protein n=1 Tax=Dendrobium thyrsiflorum TaxID=117978 RepID=A0ABD0UZD7_DENTH
MVILRSQQLFLSSGDGVAWMALASVGNRHFLVSLVFQVSSPRLRAMVEEMGEEEVLVDEGAVEHDCVYSSSSSVNSPVSTASASQNELVKMKNTTRRQNSLKSSPLSVSIVKESTEVELSSRNVQFRLV